MLALLHCFAGLLNLHTAVKSLEAKKRPSAQKTVSAQAFAVDDALKEKRPIAFLNLAKRGDGRKRVANKLAINRHHVGIASQVDKLIKCRSMRSKRMHREHDTLGRKWIPLSLKR